MIKTITLVTIFIFSCQKKVEINPLLTEVKSSELFLYKLSVDSSKVYTIISHTLDSLKIDKNDYGYYQNLFKSDYKFRLLEIKKIDKLLKDSIVIEKYYKYFNRYKNLKQ